MLLSSASQRVEFPCWCFVRSVAISASSAHRAGGGSSSLSRFSLAKQSCADTCPQACVSCALLTTNYCTHGLLINVLSNRIN